MVVTKLGFSGGARGGNFSPLHEASARVNVAIRASFRAVDGFIFILFF